MCRKHILLNSQEMVPSISNCSKFLELLHKVGIAQFCSMEFWQVTRTCAECLPSLLPILLISSSSSSSSFSTTSSFSPLPLLLLLLPLHFSFIGIVAHFSLVSWHFRVKFRHHHFHGNVLHLSCTHTPTINIQLYAWIRHPSSTGCLVRPTVDNDKLNGCVCEKHQNKQQRHLIKKK